jgi:hypothetical protein
VTFAWFIFTLLWFWDTWSVPYTCTALAAAMVLVITVGALARNLSPPEIGHKRF